jgi:hypothetical protein
MTVLLVGPGCIVPISPVSMPWLNRPALARSIVRPDVSSFITRLIRGDRMFQVPGDQSTFTSG